MRTSTRYAEDNTRSEDGCVRWAGSYAASCGPPSDTKRYVRTLISRHRLRELWARAHWGGAAGIVSYIAATMLCATLLAVLAHFLVERPLLRVVRRALSAPLPALSRLTSEP